MRRFVSKFLGVSLRVLQVKRDVPVNMGQVPRQTPFVTLLVQTLRAFGKGVLSRSSLGCSFSALEAKSDVHGNTRHVPPKTGRIFRMSALNLAPNLKFPEFYRTFRALLPGKRRPQNIHQNSPPFLTCHIPRQSERKKIFGDRDRGRQNVPNAGGGGNSPRKLPLEDLDF